MIIIIILIILMQNNSNSNNTSAAHDNTAARPKTWTMSPALKFRPPPSLSLLFKFFTSPCSIFLSVFSFVQISLSLSLVFLCFCSLSLSLSIISIHAKLPYAHGPLQQTLQKPTCTPRVADASPPRSPAYPADAPTSHYLL